MLSQEGCDPPVAMAPSPSYLPTALPKSVNSRATHDGEGAVATANPQMQSEIANSQLPTIRRHLHLSTSTRLRPFPTTARAPSPRTGGRNKCDPPVSILGRRGPRPSRGDGAVATYGRSQQVRPSRVDLRSQWTATLPRNARRRGRRRYGRSSNAIVNRKSKNRKSPTINYHLHLYTSTRPFFKSLNAPILKCNRKSEIAYCVRIGECGIIRARFCN